MTRHIIVGIPKAGNNLLACYLERKLGIKRSEVWGISSMDVLNTTRAALFNKVYKQAYQGIISGIIMQAEVPAKIIQNKLNQVQDNEYIICHMPYSFAKLIPDDYKVHVMTRDLIEIVESQYHYIHNEDSHPMHQLFNNTDYEFSKYKYIIDGVVFTDYNMNSIFEAAMIINQWKNQYPWYYYDDIWKLQKTDPRRKNHVFRKGTPGNYRETMPEIVQKYFEQRTNSYINHLNKIEVEQ